jgi:hypothetical protein
MVSWSWKHTALPVACIAPMNSEETCQWSVFAELHPCECDSFSFAFTWLKHAPKKILRGHVYGQLSKLQLHNGLSGQTQAMEKLLPSPRSSEPAVFRPCPVQHHAVAYQQPSLSCSERNCLPAPQKPTNSISQTTLHNYNRLEPNMSEWMGLKVFSCSNNVVFFWWNLTMWSCGA